MQSMSFIVMYGVPCGTHCKRQALLQHLLSLLLLLLWCAPAHTTRPLLVTDADMGIHTYDSIVQISKQPVNLRTQLRFICNSPQQDSSSADSSGAPGTSSVTVEGFVSAFSVSSNPPAWSLQSCHYMALNIRHLVNLTIHSGDSITPLPWVGPRDYGLWHVRTQLTGPGPFSLSVLGADTLHPLPQPLCPQQQQQQQSGTPDLAGGIWNVLTTTSISSIDASTLAFLVLQHNAYHRTMGFSGTILRSNVDESREMVRLPEVQEAVQEQGLIIWPWEHEHVASWSTHFWQKPKNQHTLLGTYGRQAKIAFFDLDEYLVLPGGHTVNEAECFGKPLLHMGTDGRTGSWVFIRYQAKSCPNATSGGDMACWQQGWSPGTSDLNLQLHQDMCPMGMDHGKHIIVSDMVDTISVHFAWSEHFKTNTMINTTCGHLLHFYGLVDDRRGPTTTRLKSYPALRWDVNPATGRREVHWPEGLSPYSISCDPIKFARVLKLNEYYAVLKRKAKAGLGQAAGKQKGAAAAAAAAARKPT